MRGSSCSQLTETFAVTRKQAEGGEYPQTILKLPFGTTKMVAYAKNKICMLVRNKNVQMFTGLITVDPFLNHLLLI